MSCPVVLERAYECGDTRQARGHNARSDQKQRAATNFVDDKDGREGRNDENDFTAARVNKKWKEPAATDSLPITPDARREVVFPLRPSPPKMVGASV